MSEDNKGNVHSRHRERVRERFLSGGLDGFPDINVLEFLLFYSQPYGDTNITAHRLLDTFGSLTAVLEAPYEELLKIRGVGAYTAVFLTLMPQLAKRYTAGKVKGRVNLMDDESLNEFIRAEYLCETNESIKLLCFNNSGTLLNCCDVSLGTKTKVHLDKRCLLETAFRNNASVVVLTHNHPNGIAVPSSADVATTNEVFKVLKEVDIVLADHIIVSGSELFSMVKSAKYCSIFI